MFAEHDVNPGPIACRPGTWPLAQSLLRKLERAQFCQPAEHAVIARKILVLAQGPEEEQVGRAPDNPLIGIPAVAADVRFPRVLPGVVATMREQVTEGLADHLARAFLSRRSSFIARLLICRVVQT